MLLSVQDLRLEASLPAGRLALARRQPLLSDTVVGWAGNLLGCARGLLLHGGRCNVLRGCKALSCGCKHLQADLHKITICLELLEGTGLSRR